MTTLKTLNLKNCPINVIGDIAGNYNTLQALLEKMPEGLVVSLGDMVDRGPRSLEVLDFFRHNGIGLLGNHEDLMLDSISGSPQYEAGLWLYNGGTTTYNQFRACEFSAKEEYIEYLRSLNHRLIAEYDNEKTYSITHTFPRSHEAYDQDYIWTRKLPIEQEGIVQIGGHNSNWGFTYFGEEGKPYAVCIDSSKSRILTGMHLPTMKIFTQENID